MDFTRISDIADQKEKTAKYKEVISTIVASKDLSATKGAILHLLNEDVSLVVSRAVLNHLCELLHAKISTPRTNEEEDWYIELIQSSLEEIKSRSISFEEADASFRELLATIYMENEEFTKAARLLGAINLENGSRQYTEQEKAAKYVKIAELFLQDDETVDADNFINRASRVIHDVTNDWALKLRYQVSFARILDSKRKFLDASLRYYELSLSNEEEIDADDLFELLKKSVTCALLAAAGPQKSRILGNLFKDERVKNSEFSSILEKMYMEQLLRKPQVENFEKSLMPHQKAVLANGLTVLDQAVLEHNMVAISKIYNNISLSELGLLLEIDATKAEKIVALMIMENRLKGSIDQVLEMVDFVNDDDVLQTWDERITSLCFDINNCLESVTESYPEFEAS